MAVFTDKLSHMDSSLENSYLIDGSGNSSPGCSEVLAGWERELNLGAECGIRHLNVVL